LGKLFLFIDHGDIFEPYPLALVFVPTHTGHALKCLDFAREGLADEQCHNSLWASVVNASHCKLTFGNDKFEWAAIQASQKLEICVWHHLYQGSFSSSRHCLLFS